jgi:copper homeostasis protein (lipoprotein)
MSSKKKSVFNIKPKILITALSLALVVVIILKLQAKPAASPVQTAETEITGIYAGDLPCADCPGITETLTLNPSETPGHGRYILEDLYQERSPEPFKTTGSWKINKPGILELIPDSPESQPQYFQITKEGNLQMLDSNMQIINSPFNSILQKQFQQTK